MMSVGALRTSFRWGGGEVSGGWHWPKAQAGVGLILAHGAGYNMNTRLLIDVGNGLASRGIAVLRFNFPYTEAGRRRPDPQPCLEACYREVAREVAKQIPVLFLGGRSMGGRIASHIVASGFTTAGLIFLGYPLHPPGRPERLRDAHLRHINAPMLFLQGTRDSFATPELLHRTIMSLPSAMLIEIEGGDHSFKVPGRAASEVTGELTDAMASFITGHSKRDTNAQ